MNDFDGKVITVTEYFELAHKESLTEEEKLAMEHFEDFIVNAITYEQYASDFLKSTIALYRNSIMSLYSRNEAELAQNIENNIQQKIEEKENQIAGIKNNVRVRKMSSSSGYVSSAIILVVLLNLGFIIALTILSR